MIADQGPKVIRTRPKVNADKAAQYRKMAARDKLPDGRAVTDETRGFLNRLADTLDHIAPEFPLTVHTPPTLGFEEQLNVNLGKRVDAASCLSGFVQTT